MSITPSNNQTLQPDFSELLARHPGLVGWLSSVLHNGKEVRAEDLLPGFLAECLKQDIPETAYPFSATDQGLADLQIYLQSAQEKIDAFHQPTLAQNPTEQVDTRARDETSSGEELPANKVPAITMSAMNKPTSEDQEKPREADPTEDVEDITQLATAHMPASTPAASEAVTQQKNSEANIEMAPDAAMSERVADGAEEDIAQLATVHIPATPAQTNTTESAQKIALPQPQEEELAHETASAISTSAETNTVSASLAQQSDKKAADSASESPDKDAEDIAQLATEHMPVAALVADKTGAVNDEEQEQTAQVAPLGRLPSKPLRRSKRPQRPRSRQERIVSWILLIVILGIVLVPAAFLVNFGISAYSTYHTLSDQAHSAMNHLLDVKSTFSSGSAGGSHLSGLLNTSRLQRAQQDFIASGSDFQQLQKQLKQSSTLQTVTTYFPQYREMLSSARAASQIGIDVATIGQIATSHATQLAPSFSGSLLASTGKPLVTQPLLDTLNTTIDQITPLLEDVQAQSQNVSLDALPISVSQKTQVGQLLQLLPQVISDIGITRSLLGEAGWLLGVNQPHTFLVQTMDRAELRGAGGFTGQYGELTVNGGRMAPFSLKDISLVEYTTTSVTQGQNAPQQYRSWWPFANWGLRDSNISADFPTTAQTAINLYKQETGNTVDGVISFTPVVIEHVLAVIGSIQVPGYDTTVTAQNLEDVLHYYQLNNSGIYKQIIKQPGDTSTSQRKRFTNYLSSLLMSKVRGASANELLAIASQVLADLKSKDLQMYFSDPATENVLEKYGYAGLLDRSTTHDGEYVVQQNLSASKASQFVQTLQHDTVTLDSQGGATHVLQIRLVYNQAGPVYGYDTYYDYMRVYVPPSSQLLTGDGFSSGTPLCGGNYGNCPVDGPYPGGELVCPAGQYQPGASPPTLALPDGGTWEPLQTLGGPTNTVSDEAGRAMYGGWVIVPKNCTMNVTLSWYVPPMSSQPYSLLVQRQAGVFPELDLSILPDAADCAKLGTTGLHFATTLTRDMNFALPTYHPSAQSKSCYPHLGV